MAGSIQGDIKWFFCQKDAVSKGYLKVSKTISFQRCFLIDVLCVHPVVIPFIDSSVPKAGEDTYGSQRVQSDESAYKRGQAQVYMWCKSPVSAHCLDQSFVFPWVSLISFDPRPSSTNACWPHWEGQLVRMCEAEPTIWGTREVWAEAARSMTQMRGGWRKIWHPTPRKAIFNCPQNNCYLICLW